MGTVGRWTAMLAGCAAAAGHAQQSPTQVNVTNDAAYRWGEPEIAVNLKNPDNLIITMTRSDFTYACKSTHAQKCTMVKAKSGYTQPYGMLFDEPGFSAVVTFVTFDGGTSWKGVPAPALARHPELVLGGHPTATAGPDGSFHIAWNLMRFEDLPTIPVSHGAVVVSNSVDGGLTWSAPVISGTPVDHPYITADPVSGRVHVAAGAPGQLGPMSTADAKAPLGTVRDRFLAASSGRGWSAPRPFGGPTGGSGVASAHGLFATAFRSTSPSTCGVPAPASCTIFQTTSDGGGQWSRHVVAIPRPFSGAPLVAADPSKPGHFAVAVLAETESAYHVYRTTDAGKSWSGPAVLKDPSGKKLYLGWIAYSPKGVLGAAWRAKDPIPPAPPIQGDHGPVVPGAPFTVWVAVSQDGGASFSQPLKVSDTTSPAPDTNPPFAGSIDGRTTLVLGNDSLYVTWGDWRTPDISVFFSRVALSAFRPN